jgi:hypothetical protein
METTNLPTDETNSNQSARSESKEKPQIIINATEKNSINALRSDVNELSSSVQTAVGDLKKSIADIRSSVSEMENPFNVLRTASDSEKLPPGVKSLVIGKPEENVLDEKEVTEEKPTVQKTENIVPKKLAIVPPALSMSQPIKVSAYLDWVWGLLEDGLTAENIRQLVNLCELTNYLPKQASEYIYSLALTAEKIRLIGFTKSHLLLFMYKAASLSKTNIDAEDMKALLDLTEKQLRTQKDE